MSEELEIIGFIAIVGFFISLMAWERFILLRGQIDAPVKDKENDGKHRESKNKE